MSKDLSNGAWRCLGAALIGFVGLSSANCALDGSRERSAFDQQLQRTRAALYAAGDADSLAAGALLVWGEPDGGPEERLAGLARAAALAPDRADFVWLQIETCSHMDSCDPTPLVETLHTLDPQNAAAWAQRRVRRGRGSAARGPLPYAYGQSITLTALRKNADALEYLRLSGTYRSEQEVVLAIIKTAGKDPAPPMDWKESVPGG